MPIGRWRALTLGSALAMLAAGISVAAARPTSSGTTREQVGALTLTPGGVVQNRRHPNVMNGYLALRNDENTPVQILAATSPAAASVIWRTTRQVVTTQTLFTAGALCEDATGLRDAAGAQAAAVTDLVVPAHRTLALRPGTGALVLTGISGHVPGGRAVAVTLYFDDGARVTGQFPVRS